VDYIVIKIVPYRPEWRDEFFALGGALRQTLRALALRIDHIGSTAVPGLAAKDIIDIQITVRDFDPVVEHALDQAGYQRIRTVSQDHVPPGSGSRPDDWIKWLFKPAANQRPVNVHVRLPGRVNQRYALLFRDYLRTQPAMAQTYAEVKSALAKHHPQDLDAYYAIKDPVCDLIIGGAEPWATATGWEPGPSDC
jgi:GrpB-like predicted nucleotidyltransferase (UPF0157 family)